MAEWLSPDGNPFATGEMSNRFYLVFHEKNGLGVKTKII